MQKTTFLILSTLLLGACNQAVKPQNASPSVPVNVAKPEVLGVLRLTSNLSEDETFVSSMEFTSTTSFSAQGKGGSLNSTAAPTPVDFDLNFSPSSRSSGVLDYRGGSSSVTRYYANTLAITNNTPNQYSNLTLFALGGQGGPITQTGANFSNSAIGDTGIAFIRNGIGAEFDSATSQNLALGFKPSHGMRRSSTGIEVDPIAADMQIFTDGEAADVLTAGKAAGVLVNTNTVLPYGYVARNASGGRGFFPTGCTQNSECNKGVITLGYKFPRPAIASRATQFSNFYLVVSQPKVRITQSVEEQADSSAITSRIASLSVGGTDLSQGIEVAVLKGSTYVPSSFGSITKTNFCDVKVTSSGSRYLVGDTTASTCP